MAGDPTPDEERLEEIGTPSAIGTCADCGREVAGGRKRCFLCREAAIQSGDESAVEATTDSPIFGNCIECGRVITADRDRCALCVGDAPPPPDEARPHPGLAHKYRSAGTLAIALRMMFTAWFMLAAVEFGSLVVLFRMVDAVVDNPFAYAWETLDRQIGLWDSMYWVELGFGAVLAFLFITWMFRAYGNLRALGATGASFGRGWSIGGWFLPFANLVIPKKIADDIWKSSDADTRAGAAWRINPLDWRIHAWWAAFVAGRIAIVISNLGIQNDASPQAIRNGVVWALLGVVLQMASAVFAVWFVSNASARQAAGVAATGRLVAERDAAWRVNQHVVALPVFAVLLAIAGYMLFDVGAGLDEAGTPAGDGTSRYEGYGVSFSYDESFMAIEQGLVDSTPSDFAGAVFLATPDQNTVAFITWISLPASMFDAEADLDLLIDNIGTSLGTRSMVVRGDLVEITEGPGPFSAKTFRIDSDVGFASGAAATGICADGDRGIQMMLVEDGVAQIDAEGQEDDNPQMRDLIAILATLEC